MERVQKHNFIKTVQQGDTWVAMFADASVVGGASGVEALRSASKMGTFNAVRMREGVHFYNAKQLTEWIEKLKNEENMELSAKAFTLALQRIDERQSGATQKAAPKALAKAM